MAKKILSIVLASIMLMSVLVVGSFATESSETKVKKYIIGVPYYNEDYVYEKSLANDPNVIEENLYFWNDEIINDYNNAKTEADWAALYKKMSENWVYAYDDEDGMGVLEEYYPLYQYNGKAVTDIYFETDKEYAKPGDIITLTVSISTNYYCRTCEVGAIYDKTLLELVPGSVKMVPVSGRVCDIAMENYGILSGSGKDYRYLIWPASMRDNKNGEYDKYGMVKIMSSYDMNDPTAKPGTKFNKTPTLEAKFKVKEGVADGTKLDFFSVEGSNPVISDFQFQEANGNFATLFKTSRIIGENSSFKPFDLSEFDQTYNFNNTFVTVGEPAPETADYTALDAAIADYTALEASKADYKTASWAAYEDAKVEGANIARNLPLNEQGVIDAATDAIVAAKEALEKNSVISATQNGTAVLGENASISVVVDGNPSLLRFTDNSAASITFSRDLATIVDNGDGTETWTVDILTTAEKYRYDVRAQYANWTENSKEANVIATNGVDLNVYSIVVSDMYPEDGNGGVVVKGKHKVVVTTGADVYKIQFVDTKGRIEDGCTVTYTRDIGGHLANVQQVGDQLVWTFDFAFGPCGEWSMPVRTRSTTTTFKSVDASLDAYVVY